MRAPTIKDVAERAGVSLGTASRVLSGHPSTSERSRERVRRAAEELGYLVNANARSLRASRTGLVGLLVPDVAQEYFGQLVAHLQSELLDHSLVPVVGSASEDPDRQDRFLRALREQRIDGAILIPQSGPTEELSRFTASGTPTVLLDRPLSESPLVSVTSDPGPGIRGAVEDLAAHGHRDLVYVAGLLQSQTGRERLAVFEEAVGSLVDGARTRILKPADLGGAWTAELEVALSDGATAIVLDYPPNTATTIRHLRRTGRRVGSDVSVVAFDDIPAFTLVAPPLSVIAQHPQRIATAAVDSLVHLLHGEAPSSTRVGTSYIARESVGAVGSRDSARTNATTTP